MNNPNIDQLMKTAIELHRKGLLPEARKQYESVLKLKPNFSPAVHNLGMVLLGQGMLKPGVQLIESVLADNIPFPEQAQTYREVGMTLYRARYWEEAQPWLEKAADFFPDDTSLQVILKRIALPDYLTPEVYDPLAGEVLKRYAPREAPLYVYVIDIMGTCNLRCPTCPVGNSRNAVRPKGAMPLDLFKEIVRKILKESTAGKPEVWLFNWGEPLLHPDLPEFIEILHNHSLRCQLSSNLNIEKGLKDAIRAEPDVLKVSISGFQQANYSKTHSGGSIHLLKSNLYMLRYYLDTFKATTKVWVGHHIYRSTFHQAEQVKSLCNELGFEYQSIQAFYQPLEKILEIVNKKGNLENDPILNDLLIHPKQNIAHIQAHRTGDYDCELRFNQTVINSDGSLALCCGVYESENMLGAHFLEMSQHEIDMLKYNHPFCKKCRSAGLDYSVSQLPMTLTPTTK